MKHGYEFDTFSYKGDSIKDGRTGAWERTPVYGYLVGIIGMRVGVFRKISGHGTVLLSSCSYVFQCYS